MLVSAHIDYSKQIAEIKRLRIELEDVRKYWTYTEKYDIILATHYFTSMLSEMIEYNNSFLGDFLRTTEYRFRKILSNIKSEDREIINA